MSRAITANSLMRDFATWALRFLLGVLGLLTLVLSEWSAVSFGYVFVTLALSLPMLASAFLGLDGRWRSVLFTLAVADLVVILVLSITFYT
jgi:hypothetical protein